MCSDNFHLRLVLSSLSKYFLCVLLWISILRNEVKGEIKLQRESRNILHKTNMRWDVREGWQGKDREELIKRRIEVWVVLGLKHLLSFSIVSLSIFWSWRLPHRTLWCSPNSVQWITASDLCPLFWIHIKMLTCGQPPDSFLGLT